jgi:HlyD family secretion protein
MTANLSIIVDQKQDVIKVPNMALRFQPALTQDQYKKFLEMYGDKFDLKNNSMVWTLENEQGLKPIIVSTGITDGLFTEIKSGNLNLQMPVIVGVSSNATTSSAAKRFTPAK